MSKASEASEASEASAREPIAVIGMGCRFPRAEGADEYWALLRDGVDAISEVPADRWDVEALGRDASERARACSRWGGFVEHGDWFDAPLFGIAAREAERMDPQQGLLLEVAWQALEHAAIAPRALAGSATGVFVGVSTSDFDRKLCRELANLDLRAGTGTSYAINANRLSYALGLCGPSVVVDLACASSLAAVHLACQALWLDDCALALAGGVHLVLSPEKTVTFSQRGVLAQDGRCKAFSENADGYARAEGGGVVVMKRLSDATRDGDRVFAVIRGSALNHNGASNGLSAPFGPAQQRVIRRALEVAGVAPSSIGYVEAHGTGTVVGDTVEVNALKAVLSEGRRPDQPCVIGSVKSNLGHLEAAAGIASLQKTVLALHHGWLPASLYATPPSKHLRIEGTPFRIATGLAPWPRGGTPRRAGVSCFGFGGSNAHLVVEEAPARPERASPGSDDAWILPISALTRTALDTLLGRYAGCLDALAGGPDPRRGFADACVTAALGRTHFAHRVAIVASHPADAARAVRAFVAGGPAASTVYHGHVAARRPSRVVFAFDAEPIDEDAVLATIARLAPWGIAPDFLCPWDASTEPVVARVAAAVARGPASAPRVTDLPSLVTRAAADGEPLAILHPGRDTPIVIAARAFAAGIDPDWRAILGPGQACSLPTYPFERRRHWTIPHSAPRSADPRANAVDSERTLR